MRILLVTPAPPGSHHGNRVTAQRWQRLLAELGHEVTVAEAYDGQPAHLLVALHARRSAAAVERFGAERPGAPIVVVLTGTDLYPDLVTSGVPASVLEAADRLVVLQDLGVAQLPEEWRDKARVVVQSAIAVPAPPPVGDRFGVVVLAHLRPVKDPLLVARALRLLPASSRVDAVHLGAPLDAGLGAAAEAESADNPRYRWLGDRPHHEALRALAGAHLLVLTSLHEGGANVVSEAVAAGVPVVSTRVPGSIGFLGPDYPGYVPVGDAAALARLLGELEGDEAGCYAELRRRCAALRPLVAPARERDAWAEILAELGAAAKPGSLRG